MADMQQQQVTSQTPATKQKNPKCVAAGKAIAKKTKQASEAQKKALAEARIIIANNQLKQADPPPVSDAPSADPAPVSDALSAAEPTKNVVTTTQRLSVISIILSLAGVYYKREEIKSVFTKKPRVNPPSPVVLLALPPSPVDAKRKVGIKKMD